MLAEWAARPLQERFPPFRGPIHAAIQRAEQLGGAVLVAPDASGGEAAARAAAYVEQIHGQIFRKKGVDPVSATAVTSEDLAGRALVLYGTAGSNPQPGRFLREADWIVAADGVTLGGRRFEGERLVLVACRPRANGAALPVLVYAAARDEDLVGIHNLFHGPTDWIVGRSLGGGRFEEVARGDFPKTLNGRWSALE